ncbi:hypothetical protein Tco_0613734 [Tanacetum coccineum]
MKSNSWRREPIGESRLGAPFCKEILKGGMVRMHYAFVHDETLPQNCKPKAKSLLHRNISSNERSQFGANQELELPSSIPGNSQGDSELGLPGVTKFSGNLFKMTAEHVQIIEVLANIVHWKFEPLQSVSLYFQVRFLESRRIWALKQEHP